MWDWRKAVSIAEKEGTNPIKWTKDGESRKFVKAFDGVQGRDRCPWSASAMHWLMNELGCGFPLFHRGNKSFAICETWLTWAKDEGFVRDPKEEVLHGDLCLFRLNSDTDVDHIGIAVGFKYINQEYPSGRNKLTRCVRVAAGDIGHDKHKDGMFELKLRNPESLTAVIRVSKDYVWRPFY